MGVIKRQALKQSVVNYFSVFIGFISIIFIYPLDLATYGLAQTYIDLAIVLTPIATFGATSIVIRFFPQFRYPEGEKTGFLGIMLLYVLASLLLFGLLVLGLQSYFLKAFSFLDFDLSVFQNSMLALTLFSLAYLFCAFFNNYIRNYNRIVIQSIFLNLLPKIGLPCLILLILNNHFSWLTVGWGLAIIYTVALIGLLIYAYMITDFDFKPRFKYLDSNKFRQIITYGAFASIGFIGSILATKLDSLMISTLIDTTSTGIYKVTGFMALIIDIPARSINAISGPIISKAWQDNDMAEIKHLYNRSSAILGSLGTVIFVLVAINIIDIIGFTTNPEDLMLGLGVFYLLGLATLLDLFTGVNSLIIMFSDYYKFNIVTIAILAVINLSLNYYMLTVLNLGITGVALATLIALAVYNAAKLIFIWVKLGVQPLSFETVKIIFFGLLCYGIGTMIPDFQYSLLTVAIKCILIGGLYTLLLFVTNTCPEYRSMLNNLLLKISQFINQRKQK